MNLNSNANNNYDPNTNLGRERMRLQLNYNGLIHNFQIKYPNFDPGELHRAERNARAAFNRTLARGAKKIARRHIPARTRMAQLVMSLRTPGNNNSRQSLPDAVTRRIMGNYVARVRRRFSL